MLSSVSLPEFRVQSPEFFPLPAFYPLLELQRFAEGWGEGTGSRGGNRLRAMGGGSSRRVGNAGLKGEA